MIDILGIGEALIEFVELDNGLYQQAFAGDVLNTLFYANRLGLKCEFFSTIGKDSYSKQLRSFFDKEGIIHDNVAASATRNNGLYIVRTNTEGEPSFTFFRERSAAKQTFLLRTQEECSQIFSASRVLLFSSIGLAIFDAPERIITAIRACPKKPLVYFDTNVRASLWKDLTDLPAMIESLSDIVDVISISKGDDAQLYEERSSTDCIEYFVSLGYKNIIVRDGENPVYFHFDGLSKSIDVEPVEKMVDATGAGDAFNAGFLYGLLHQFEIADAITFGNRSATQVLKERGGIVRSYSKAMVINE